MRQRIKQLREQDQIQLDLALNGNESKRLNFDADLWDLREFGAFFPPSYRSFSVNFGYISQPWLKAGAKQLVKLAITRCSGNTCRNKFQSMKTFSDFLNIEYPEMIPSKIERDCIVSFMLYLNRELRSGARKNHILSDLRELINLGTRFGWLEIPNPNIIYYPDDYHKVNTRSRASNKTIPEEVIDQIIANLDALHQPVATMVVIMMEVPIRISEVCGMRWDCITYDATGDPWLRFWNWKLNKEHEPLPITSTLADMIKVQQAYIREHLGKDYDYLFCSPDQGRKSAYHGLSCRECERPARTRGYCQKHYLAARKQNRLLESEIVTPFWPIAEWH